MKAAVYFAEGFEEIEALAVVDILRRGGVETLMTGVGSMTQTGAHQISINMDTTIDQLSHDEVDMMILPGGGLGVKNLKASQTLNEHLKAFKKEGKWIAAICAAPSVIGTLGLLEGEKAICYPGWEDQLKGATITKEKVVVSGRFITSMGPGTAYEFGFKVLEVLKGKAAADKVRQDMLAD